MRSKPIKILISRPAILKIAILSIFLACTQSVHAQNINALKAAYVFYFSKFVSWEDTPLNNIETINICFKDDDYAIQKQFYSLTGKTNGNKPLKIIDINDKDIKDITCHILYSSSIDQELINNSKHTLLVSNENETAADVNFLIQKNKLRFNIDRDKTNKKQLKVSSRLLRLAAKVSNK